MGCGAGSRAGEEALLVKSSGSNSLFGAGAPGAGAGAAAVVVGMAGLAGVAGEAGLTGTTGFFAAGLAGAGGRFLPKSEKTTMDVDIKT